MSDLTPETVEAALSIRGPGGISQSRTLTGSDRVIREAARKYANPDYEAMLRILWEHFYDDMEGNPTDPDEAWEYNKEWSKIQMSGLPERLWAAALGVTEPK